MEHLLPEARSHSNELASLLFRLAGEVSSRFRTGGSEDTAKCHTLHGDLKSSMLGHIHPPEPSCETEQRDSPFQTWAENNKFRTH